MAFSCNPLIPAVAYTGAVEPDKRKCPPKEKVDFLIARKLLKDTGGNQAVIRMIVYNLRTHHVDQFVETLCGMSLEKTVRIPVAANSVNHLCTVLESLYHLIDGIDIILPVTVHGDCNVTVILHFHKSREKRVLVSTVPAQRYPCKQRRFF